MARYRLAQGRLKGEALGIFSKLFGKPRKPDIEYAAHGFTYVSARRLAGIRCDLHSLERQYAGELLSEGCTDHQAMSARWGGTCAITGDMRHFEILCERAAQTFDGGKGMLGDEKETALAAYHAAAAMFLSMTLAGASDEYEKFLQHIGR